MNCTKKEEGVENLVRIGRYRELGRGEKVSKRSNMEM